MNKIKIKPNYYEDFTCIADKCKDNCCIGWEIEIDDKTYRKYKKVKGDLGERFKKDLDKKTFILKNNRCPFLNDSNLCDIQACLGGNYLCKVCREYPRFTVEVDGITKLGLSLSCEEVGRIIFTQSEKVSFNKNDFFYQGFAGKILYIEKEIINILQDRNFKISNRVRRFLAYVFEAQDILNEDYEDPLPLLKSIKKVCPDYKNVPIEPFLEEVCYIFKDLEVLNDEWLEAFMEFKGLTSGIVSELNNYNNKNIENWFENILIYFVHRYFIRATYDGDIVSWTRFIFLGFFTIRGLAALVYQNSGKLELNDIVRASKIYSKEIEHSEENIAYLLEEMLFSEEFNLEELMKLT